MAQKRSANPKTVQHVWDAVRKAIIKHERVDMRTILVYQQEVEKCSVDEAEVNLQKVIQDGLLIRSQLTSTNCDEADLYQIPEKNVEKPNESTPTDWYCFECHSAGDVIECSNCYRVFHVSCVRNVLKKCTELKTTGSYTRVKTVLNSTSTALLYKNITAIVPKSDDFNSFNNNVKNTLESEEQSEVDGLDTTSCTVCNISRMKLFSEQFCDSQELNYLLKFVVCRIRSWLPSKITHTMAAEDQPEWLTEEELYWRANQLFYKPMDMLTIEKNLNSDGYAKASEFLADILTIQHNVGVFHGNNSQEFEASELMLQDCLYDLAELRTCSNCYRHSNEKINNRWFCLPCRKPHTLVWAKQKGYPYWPAKIIRENRTHCDVRFFGGKYERSVLSKTCVKPITTPRKQLQIKITSGFNKAMEELRYHQKLLDNPEEIEKIRNNSAAKTNQKMQKSAKTNGSSCSVVVAIKRKRCSITDDDAANKKHPTLKRIEKITDSSQEMDTNSTSNQLGETQNEKVAKEPPKSHEDSARSPQQVSSSTENINGQNCNESKLFIEDDSYNSNVQLLGQQLQALNNKDDIIKCAMDYMQNELEIINNGHNEQLKQLTELHNAQMVEIKKKQWCYNCGKDAIYHCCWNTAYCSKPCQQQHWESEHKKVCRRRNH